MLAHSYEERNMHPRKYRQGEGCALLQASLPSMPLCLRVASEHAILREKVIPTIELGLLLLKPFYQTCRATTSISNGYLLQSLSWISKKISDRILQILLANIASLLFQLLAYTFLASSLI